MTSLDTNISNLAKYESNNHHEAPPADWLTLPEGLPVPTDDGLADHLRADVDLSSRVILPPGLLLHATESYHKGDKIESTMVDLRALSFRGPVVVFVYPRTGRPGVKNPTGWDAIPGARGCTPELCAVRDTLDELLAAKPGRVCVFALSTQSSVYQSEVAARLQLPYSILSDEPGTFSSALRLPTFEVDGMVLLRRITLVLYQGTVVGRDYPVFPSNEAASRALDLLVSIFGN